MEHPTITRTGRWRRRIGTAGAVAVAATLALAGLPLLATGPVDAAFPGENGRIAFSHDGDIWVMNPDGTDRQNLTMTPTLHERAPAWSPDGTQIAFMGGTDIFVMRADGTDRENLTRTPTMTEEAPTWSPRGDEIAFVRGVEGGGDVFVMFVDGTHQTNVTRTPTASEGAPAWSPRGDEIAFVRGVEGGGDVFVMFVDGTHQTNVTRTPTASEGAPAWSPRGDEISYARDVDGQGDVFVMFVDGTHQENVTRTFSMHEWSPAWSPDGNQIAFGRDGETFVMAPDGTNPESLGPGTGPDWQPLPAAGPPVSCEYKNDDPTTRTLVVSVVNETPDAAPPDHVERAVLDRDGDEVVVEEDDGNVVCMEGIVNVHTIEVVGTEARGEQVRIRPGLAELHVDVNADAGGGIIDSVVLVGSDRNDTIVVGSNGADTDGDGDVDATLTDVRGLEVQAGPGNDYVTGQGDDFSGPCNTEIEIDASSTGDPTDIRLNIFGGTGNDHLTGGNQPSRFDNLFGDGPAAPPAGNDCLDGAGGRDRAVYQFAADGMTVDLLSHVDNATGECEAGRPAPEAQPCGLARGGDGNDTLFSIDAVSGSHHDDVLLGDDGNNGLAGRRGDDTLVGRGGDDGVNGSAGCDAIHGHYEPGDPRGDLVADGSDANGFRAVEVTGPTYADLRDQTAITADCDETEHFTSIENLNGSDFDDTLIGDDDVNRLQGWGGNDALVGLGGTNVLVGFTGADSLVGGPERDVMNGGPGHDHLEAGPGDDLVRGDTGDDILSGGLDVDVLDGGTDEDGQDADTCNPGPGDDADPVNCETAAG